MFDKPKKKVYKTNKRTTNNCSLPLLSKRE